MENKGLKEEVSRLKDALSKLVQSGSMPTQNNTNQFSVNQYAAVQNMSQYGAAPQNSAAQYLPSFVGMTQP